MIIYAETDEIWTFNEINNISNKLAHYFLSQGFQKGDTIAIFMENDPKYMIVLLALAKIGVTAALINNHLRHEALMHSINIAKCRGIVYQFGLEEALIPISSNLIAPRGKSPFQLFCIQNGFRVRHLLLL